MLKYNARSFLLILMYMYILKKHIKIFLDVKIYDFVLVHMIVICADTTIGTIIGNMELTIVHSKNIFKNK